MIKFLFVRTLTLTVSLPGVALSKTFLTAYPLSIIIFEKELYCDIMIKIEGKGIYENRV